MGIRGSWLGLIVYIELYLFVTQATLCGSETFSVNSTEAPSKSAPHPTTPTWPTDPSIDATTTRAPQRRFLDTARAFIANNMGGSAASGVARKILQADISGECSVGILQFMRALRDMEPWAVRLIDSTAKYPNGLLQVTGADMGAYDECIETVIQNEDGLEKVRAQYCNLHVQSGGDGFFLEELLPALEISHKRLKSFAGYLNDKRLTGIRLGVCFISECTERDLQSIVDIFVGGVAKVTVKNCVTSREEPMSNTQVWIVAVLGVISAAIILSSAVDAFSTKWPKERTDGSLFKYLTAFSAIENTKFLFKANRNKCASTYNYRFIHGLRFLSIFWIALGHSYGTIGDNMSRLVNALHYFEHWHTLIVTFGYQAVDTFFFLSGFFIYFKLYKENGNRLFVGVMAIIRRFIRVTVPTFFMIMCMYLLPLVASGPNSKDYYSRFYKEIQDHWWDLLLLIRNWREDAFIATLPHLWYLSSDFQLFLVSLIVIQTFKTKKWLVTSTFAVLSLLFCAIAAWQIYGTIMTPFLVAVTPSFSTFINTLNRYYSRPFYHGVCFFSGCVTFLMTQKYGTRKISKVLQGACWCLGLSCGLYCLFMKHDWYRSDGRATEARRMLYAFTDRILWSICLSWFVFACASNRAGPVSRFLSWEGFLPLSRLSFGVYLIHSPFFLLSSHIARERIFYSHYTLVSACFSVIVWCYILAYMMFVACEGPISKLEMLIFARRKRGPPVRKISELASGHNEDGRAPPFTKDTYPVPADPAHMEKGCRL